MCCMSRAICQKCDITSNWSLNSIMSMADTSLSCGSSAVDSLLTLAFALHQIITIIVIWTLCLRIWFVFRI